MSCFFGEFMKELNAVFIHSPELNEKGYPADCPFSSKRAGETQKTISNMGLLSGEGKREVMPVKASLSDLERFHSRRYLDAIKKAESGDLTVEAFAMGLGTPDCPIFKGMFEYFCLAAGATITGAKLIISKEANIAFNPSGGFHHAGPEKAAGFCYVNDIVISAMILSDSFKRVLVLDLDVHHCDAVQDAFYKRKDIMTISLHESGETLFPGTGREAEIGSALGKGYTVNIPLPVGTYDAAYLNAFDQAALPLIKKFDPEVIILELGMDALANDPLAHLNLTNNVYADIINLILKIKRPILATGGGGYNIKNTVRGWALAWSVLCGDEEYDLSLGMGGVMLENMEWSGGLRDRTLPPDHQKQAMINAEIKKVIKRIKSTVFPIHGIT